MCFALFKKLYGATLKQLKLLFVYRPVILSSLLSVELGSDCSRGRFAVGDAQNPELESESTVVDKIEMLQLKS